ncbi:MAG TPA: IS701 family transposase [Methyloceanibacter sp.]|jgi:SRSO17 transposase|nr:IS701 family transposase [Methyloceanibacter sp.]
MDIASCTSSESRFVAYLDGLVSVIGHADRERPLGDYCRGLLLPCERKSVEPMAAVTAPSRVAAQHQSLLHFVGEAPWSDEQVLAKVREQVMPAIERHGPIEAWIIDDTGFSKKGRHSVGVAHQYCGELGQSGNCQVAVTLSIANHHASLPVGYRLYLPKEWAEDQARRKKAGVPEAVAFETKPAIALAQVQAAYAAGIARGVVLADGAYGYDTRLRSGISALGLSYVVGIPSTTTVWPPGCEPLPPKPWVGHGRRPTRLRRDSTHKPVPIKALALSLPKISWRTIRWREGSNDWLCSRFARVRVRPAHDDDRRDMPHPHEWLLIEWPKGEPEPTRYWISNLPESIAFSRLVELAKLRWRIERDYQELKQEVGLGHYEGRGWRGFHHHATLCVAAYGFLISERETIPPSGPRTAAQRQTLALPEGHRPRGAADPSRASRPELDHHSAPQGDSRLRQKSRTMSLLRTPKQSDQTDALVTQ